MLKIRRTYQGLARSLSRSDDTLDLYRWLSGETEEDFQILLDWLEEAQLDRVGALPIRLSKVQPQMIWPIRCRKRLKRIACGALWKLRRASVRPRLQQKLGDPGGAC